MISLTMFYEGSTHMTGGTFQQMKIEWSNEQFLISFYELFCVTFHPICPIDNVPTPYPNNHHTFILIYIFTFINQTENESYLQNLDKIDPFGEGWCDVIFATSEPRCWQPTGNLA